ncbi:hypothetical protein C3405_00765 [Aeromonas hydrophila]|nr:hypothetical protein C2U40_10670 [Aeromonas sp. ASNIH4]POU42285.1 hypothetical protein C3405_00765 [Aeromonas hydrophila]POV91041.1 hypothetical protein C3395_00535 [Aeromonas sp. ASNIH6]
MKAPVKVSPACSRPVAGRQYDNQLAPFTPSLPVTRRRFLARRLPSTLPGGQGNPLAEALMHLIGQGRWLEQEVLVLARGWQAWPLNVTCD